MPSEKRPLSGTFFGLLKRVDAPLILGVVDMMRCWTQPEGSVRSGLKVQKNQLPQSDDFKKLNKEQHFVHFDDIVVKGLLF